MAKKFEDRKLWSDEATARLRELWPQDRHTATDISIMLHDEFGLQLSRNAIIGKAHRMRLAGKRKPAAPKPWHAKGKGPRARPRDEVRPPTKVSARTMGSWVSVKGDSVAGLAPEAIAAVTAPVERPGVSLMDLRDGKCRTVLDKRDPITGLRMYCGDPVANRVDGRGREVPTSYCKVCAGAFGVPIAA